MSLRPLLYLPALVHLFLPLIHHWLIFLNRLLCLSMGLRMKTSLTLASLLVVDLIEQKLTEVDLSELSLKHKIPPFVSLVSIGPGKSATRPPKGMIDLYTKHLESGLTLLFPDIIQVFLHYFGVTLGQLNPNI